MDKQSLRLIVDQETKTFQALLLRLLQVMTQWTGLRNDIPRNGEPLMTTRMVGEHYNIRVVCSFRGLHRFLAVVEEPYADQFVLGRLLKDGNPHLYVYGANLFLTYLKEQGFFPYFKEDLIESLALCASPEKPDHSTTMLILLDKAHGT
ncbi:MAG: hypothetical protein D6E12_14870 [Desulfovibrio sp.]|nr:MAG: hypothetical protein D6E12_14870 [Desulfovibrio sp.]